MARSPKVVQVKGAKICKCFFFHIIVSYINSNCLFFVQHDKNMIKTDFDNFQEARSPKVVQVKGFDML